jgi:LysM repeat protein
MGVMDERSSRVFIGVSLLVLLWIGTYWAYNPDQRQRTPPISFAGPGEPEADQTGAIAPILPAQPMTSSTEFPAEPPVDRPVDRPGDRPGMLSRAVGAESTPPAQPAVDPPGARVVAPAFRDHTIRAGDTFETIARRYFGSSSMAPAIARANPLKDPRRLRVGEVLRVPLDPENIQGRVVLEDGTIPSNPVRPQTPSAVEYLVKAGDTLTKIARAYYGSVRHADFIFNANRDTMADQNSLRVGQTLRLPPLPAGAASGAEAAGAGDGG